MADASRIEWTDATWNPIRARLFDIQDDGSGKERIGWHCEHVSEGCRHCYAEAMNRRLGTGRRFKRGHLYRPERRGYINGEAKLFLDEDMLTRPLRWRRPRMVFVCSMTDLFADFVPDAWIDRVFAVMALAGALPSRSGAGAPSAPLGHTFQVLTKRPERMREYCTDLLTPTRLVAAALKLPYGEVFHATWPLPNVWLGVSCEDQATADQRIPDLVATPAAVRFVSCEPLLGPVDLAAHLHRVDEIAVDALCDDCGERHEGCCEPGLDWVIVGGESGPRARPMHPDWARSLRDQCGAAGVPFFFKQWGEWVSVSEVEGPGQHHSFADGATVRRLGKARAGRTLDGRTWDQMQSTAQPASSPLGGRVARTRSGGREGRQP